MFKEKYNLKRIIHLLLFSLLIITIIVLVINWPKHDTLVKQIETSAVQIDSTHPINSKIELLSIKYGNVDNKFREFIITKDANTFKQYQTGVKELVYALDSLNKYSANETLLSKVKDGLKQKDSINGILLSVHKQLDVLLNTNPQDFAPKAGYKFVPYNIDTVANSITIDTLKSTTQTKQKKLFGRLGDALKKKKSQDVSMEKVYFKVSYDKKTVSGNVVEQIATFGTELNNYYKKIFSKVGKQQASLKQRELQLVLANKQILNNLDNLFNSYKFLGKEADKSIHKQNIDNTIEAGLKLERIIKTLLALLLATIGLLMLYSYLASRHEKKLQQEKLKSDNHAKVRERLLATMSHEIRTPINSIIGNTILLEKENLPTAAVDNVSSISFSSNSLLNIVNSTLDFLKTEKNLMQFYAEPFKPNEEISKASNSLSVLAHKKNVDFVVENLIPQDMILKGDVAKLHQVIYNLTGNAIKFTDKGKVSIKASAKTITTDKQRISVAITDSGVGIKQEDIERIFEPYFQINNKKAAQGTGLGLALCKELVVLQGGNIEVTSTMGKGSTFSFYIDYPMVADDTEIQSHANSKNNNNQIKATVFIIDDDAIQLAWLAKALSNQNLTVYTFSNALNAIDKFKELKPQYIFTDINMPEMDGLTLLNEIKKMDNSDVKIIACTGETDLDEQENYKQKGFYNVLLKPIKAEDLIKLI